MVTEEAAKEFAIRVATTVRQKYPDYDLMGKGEKKECREAVCLQVSQEDAVMAAVYSDFQYFRTVIGKLPRLAGSGSDFSKMDANARIGHLTAMHIGAELQRGVNGKRQSVASEVLAGSAPVQTLPVLEEVTVPATNGNGHSEKRPKAIDLYRQLADEYKYLPPDTMLALLTGYSNSAFALARRMLRERGYELSSIDGSQWRVDKRPNKAEALRKQVEETLVLRLKQANATELERMLVALSKN
jgi:hypothetical protein